MDIVKQIADGLERGDHELVRARVREAIECRVETATILEQGLVAGMNVVGERFRNHLVFLPEVLLSARAMSAGMELLRPLLIRDAVPGRGKVVLGSVRGDLHDIGKNLVGIMLRGAGFDVVDLGHDVPPERFVETAEREQAQIIGLSALLTTTMSGMGEVVNLVERRECRGRIKIIVGGAPVSDAFAREIGADAYGFDAASAVERVQALIAAG